MADTVAYMDIELITPAGCAILPRVECSVLPGPVAPLLLGLTELRSLGIEPLSHQIQRKITAKARRAWNPAQARLTSWRESEFDRRRKEHNRDEPDYLEALDSFANCGTPTPSRGALQEAIHGCGCVRRKLVLLSTFYGNFV